MSEKISYENLIEILDPKKTGDHAWFLSLLDDEAQKSYENEHLDAVMRMLCYLRIRPHKNAIKAAQEEIRGLEKDGNTAENYESSPNEYIHGASTDNWLFLNATVNPESISTEQTADIIFKLYLYNSNPISY